MKLVKTTEAEGRTLVHDMTEIIPGKYKGTRFRKGQIIRAEDIPVLLDMGKERLCVLDEDGDAADTRGMLHEEEGARRLCSICRGTNLETAPAREGKIELFAKTAGLLKIDTKKLVALNSAGGMAVITLRGNRSVAEGEKAAAVKIIPLFIEEEKLRLAEEICGGEKPVNVIPFKPKKAALIITGSEIFRKRIPESGSEIVKRKLEAAGAECAETVILPDEPDKITAAILGMIEKGIGLVICTGGMSVDPDDRTPLGIRNSGARIVSYGVPFMPGFLLLLSYYEKNGLCVPVIGAPACVFYEKTTALDILLPRLMADDPVSREDLALLGEGGLGGQHIQ